MTKYQPSIQRLPTELIAEQRFSKYGEVGLRVCFEALGPDGKYYPIRGKSLVLTMKSPALLWAAMHYVKMAVKEWL